MNYCCYEKDYFPCEVADKLNNEMQICSNIYFDNVLEYEYATRNKDRQSKEPMCVL